VTDRDWGRRPDVLVIGGGPGGLMAAQVLATAGAAVTVVEAMAAPGRKFLVAGRGGLNLTHSEPFERLVARYGDAALRLRPALEAFTPEDLRAWSADLGHPTFVGSSGRVFPEELRANRLLDAWLARLATLGVEVRTGHRWRGWDGDGNVVVTDPEGATHAVQPRATILALGGASWPGTGSDGSWVQILEAAGVQIAPLRPANSGIDVTWSDVFAQRFAGTPVKNVALGCAGEQARGELMVTEEGLEGGAVYALTRVLHDQFATDAPTVVHVDLRPDLTSAAVQERLGRRRPGQSRSTVLQRHVGLAPVAIGLLREVTANQLPDDDAALAALIKAVPLAATGSAPIDRAISTGGGVRFDQVDADLMLRLRPGTYVVGEMLDWEAPTGGYLLQATFSTAVAAARAALARLAGSAADGAQHHELG
jgi:uncharacterized flavoprotein (TIGR03862 family)